jgi:hypothetical protein
MTYTAPMRQRVRSVAASVVRNPISVWVAFVLVHLWLGLVNIYGAGLPFGDVTIVYKFWTDEALSAHFWVGIDSVWVYPIVALVPMLIATAFGPDQYGSTWLSMVMILNAVAFGFVTGWGRSRERIPVAWWWLAFLFLLGPIALGRIDSVSVPLGIIGMLIISSRPRVAAVVITVATWIKVWPAALLLAAVIALKSRWRIVAAAAVTSASIILIALLLGSGANVFTFITQQTGRGLQPEAPISTFFMWQALARVPGAEVFYDQNILSYAVRGPGDVVAIALMTPVLAIAILVIAVLGVRAVRAGATPGQLLPALSLALTVGFIAFNKVGSPQYIAWIAVPMVLGIATRAAGRGRSFRMPGILALVIGAMTQVLYPYWYHWLITLNPLLISALTVRNALEFVLLGWAIWAIVKSPSEVDGEEPSVQDWLPSVWPLGPRRETSDEDALPVDALGAISTAGRVALAASAGLSEK